ncbi:male sterility protein-domain-containing protein [Diaporthe sp. PMI_573]|nr:male sterility protein-domain-containing protein [Diaporthaceae sp. PMI_573]
MLPHFGLSHNEATAIFGEATRIIHNGADLSHLKRFHSLREVNLQATKRLVDMCLPRRIPIHYISSASVCELTGLDAYPELSVSAHPPPGDGSDGYTASKWASERYLEKVHERLAWPIWIHRPTNVLREHDPELDLMQNMLRYSRALRAVPYSLEWRGYFNLVSPGNVARSILREMRR